MKQLDIKNFDANMEQFYLDHEFEKTPVLEAFLQLQYPRDMRASMDQTAFNDYAKLVFTHIDPKEVHRSISATTNLIVNTVLPYCKKRKMINDE